MRAITRFLKRFVTDKKGATLAEYAVIVGVVAVAAVGTTKVLNGTVNTLVNKVGNEISTVSIKP